MDEKTFLEFYKNTVLCCSNNLQRFICKLLEDEHRITYEEQTKIGDSESTVFFESKKDFKNIIVNTTTNRDFIDFYEELEFIKLYKYSVPFFYQLKDESQRIEEVLEKNGFEFFKPEEYQPKYILDTTLKEAMPLVWDNDDILFIKFVLQKSYAQIENFERIDYRYPIIIFIDKKNKFLEIRYDALRYRELFDSEIYSKMVNDCLIWLHEKLNLEIYICTHKDTIKIINDKQNADVKMYKQMMEMKSGASAELTASENTDYVLPFIGEIKELIDENEDLFNDAEEVKQLLLQYLNEKEATASYPYIYVKWVKPVETQSYIVKITFDYFGGKYTLLQHITGNCKDLGMGRMNDAIKYLCESGSFVKGEKI